MGKQRTQKNPLSYPEFILIAAMWSDSRQTLCTQSNRYFFSFFLKKLLIYFWLCWVFVAVGRLPLAAVGRAYSLAGT